MTASLSSWELSGRETWGGSPLVRKLGDLGPRRRFVVTGRIRSTGTTLVGRAEAFSCVLEDGTGEVTLVFVGRRAIDGLAVGTRCTVEGTAQRQPGKLVTWNPLYVIEPGSCCDDRRDPPGNRGAGATSGG